MPSQDETKLPIALSAADQRQVLELYQKIQRSRAKLVGPDGKTQSLPVSLYEFLVKLIADLCEGQSVAIVQNDAQLTTVEAAQMLDVSRQFLVNLLERDEIPYHIVGTHRRISVATCWRTRPRGTPKRCQVLDELTRAEAEDGLYDLDS